MSPRRSVEPYGAEHLIERQMLLRSVKEKFTQQDASGAAVPACHFITISRDVGSLGDEIASRLGELLGWQVYDRQIVDLIAEESHTRQRLVEHLDERAQNLLEDAVQRLLGMVEGETMGVEEYHEALLRAVLTLRAKGRVILIGRGANFILRREPGVNVRILASPDTRVERLRKRWELSAAGTRKRMQQIDRERARFIRRHFKEDWNDPRVYDLVVNTDRLSPAQAAEAILSLARSREEKSK